MEIEDGLLYFPNYLDESAQQNLLQNLRAIIAQAPLFTPRMPRTGVPMSVRMTNCGRLGWVTDAEGGYRYQSEHPQTHRPWPDIPPLALEAWSLGQYEAPPEACLINYYYGDAKMGLHQDRDEANFAAPVVSLSLGDSCIFRIGNVTRGGKTRSIKLTSGDAIVLGGASRLRFHGVDRIVPGSSTLLAEGGRFNLTLRRITPLV